MSKVGFLFAGQGSQYPGMGKDFYNNFEESRKIFEISSNILDKDMAELCFNDSNNLLHKTQNTQPAILTTNMAILSALYKMNIISDISCGLSLGEYSALIHSGVIDFKDGVALVEKRGMFMQDAVKEGIGGMAAILNLSSEKINELISICSEYGVIEGSNYNSPVQTVVSGEVNAIEKAIVIAKELGGKGVKLPVSAPFHSSMLEPAAINLSKELEKINIRPINGIVLSNVKGVPYESNDNIKKILKLQVMKPVLFMNNVKYMIASGVDTFVEVGPGRALSGFVKKIDKNVNVLNVEDMKSLEKTFEKLKELEVI